MSDIIISTRTILMTVILAVSFWVVWQIRDLLLLFFVALLFAFALLPFIEKLEKKKVGRFWACLLTYAAVLCVFLLIIGFGIPPMVEQTTLFISQLPKLIESALANPSWAPVSRQFAEEAARQLASASGSILTVTLGIFNSFFALVTILVFSFYFSLEYRKLSRRILNLLSDGLRRKAEQVIFEVEGKIGAWVRGEVILMIVIALSSYIGLLILRVNYALPLALIAGLLEIVPVIGPIISAVPAAIVGFSVSPILGLGVLALFTLIQQLENNFVVPRVMEKVVGFDPLLTMAAILVGSRLFGFAGAFLAVPVALILQVLVSKLVLEKK